MSPQEDRGSTECSFLDALYAKYCDDRPVEEVELEQKDGHRRVTEYVGFDKLMESLKNVTNLPYIHLFETGISSCGAVDPANFTPFRARSLNLSLNKLASWTVVAQIVQLTRALSELVLTGNPLAAPTEEEIASILAQAGTFDKLLELVLGNLAYTWSDFCQCARLWPNIEKLHLFSNSITRLSPLDDKLHNLTYLSLSKNAIDDWSEICKLGTLQRLETLELSHCKIGSISFPSGDYQSQTHLFPALQYLDLLCNQINDWKSVAQLNRLKSLNTLLLKKNPLYDLNQYYYNFNHVIGRIANLETLDREPVVKTLREDGEKYYLRTIYPEYLQKSDATSKGLFLEENPRLLQLLDKLGEPVVAKTLSKQEKIKQNYLTLKISDDANPDESKRLIEKQMPVTTKVSNLKFILHRLLKIDIGQDFKLVITGQNYVEEMQDRDDISTYRVDDDHLIKVKRAA